MKNNNEEIFQNKVEKDKFAVSEKQQIYNNIDINFNNINNQIIQNDPNFILGKKIFKVYSFKLFNIIRLFTYYYCKF